MQATYAKDGKKVNFVIPSSLDFYVSDLHMSDKYFVCLFFFFFGGGTFYSVYCFIEDLAFHLTGSLCL